MNSPRSAVVVNENALEQALRTYGESEHSLKSICNSVEQENNQLENKLKTLQNQQTTLIKQYHLLKERIHQIRGEHARLTERHFSPFGGDCSLIERENEAIFEMCLIKDHKLIHPYTSVSVSIVKREKRTHIEENDISPFKFETNEELELSRRKSVDMENISIIPNKWSSIKETDKPKEIKNIIQTTRLRPKVSMMTNTSSINLPPSLINNTIYLDGINQMSDTLKSIKQSLLNRIERKKKKIKSNKSAAALRAVSRLENYQCKYVHFLLNIRKYVSEYLSLNIIAEDQ